MPYAASLRILKKREDAKKRRERGTRVIGVPATRCELCVHHRLVLYVYDIH